MPQLDTAYFVSQIFWLAISFGIVFVVFNRFLLPSFSGMINLRKNQIHDKISKSEDLLKKAYDLNGEADRICKKGYHDSLVLKAKMIDEIRESASKTLKDFENKSTLKIEQVHQEIESLKKKHDANIPEVIVKYASNLIFKLSGNRPDMLILTDIYNSIK